MNIYIINIAGIIPTFSTKSKMIGKKKLRHAILSNSVKRKKPMEWILVTVKWNEHKAFFH